MPLRGIRGATCINKNNKVEIVKATKELLFKIIEANKIKQEDIASIIFSTTTDLNAEFPAVAARELGYLYTPLLCMHEINVPGSIKKCIRILVHVNASTAQSKIKHIYLGKAKNLRPDLKNKSTYYLS